MSERILFVDDDRHLLAGLERNLRRQFDLDTAEGGEAGLAKLAERGPYAVVVADRQMPGMDGIQFLSLVKQRAPDTVRIMLSGNVDLESAIRVVNEGNIFRFLTKPCPPETLAKALEDARAQYRLVTAEKELLGKTLSGSVKLLIDILSNIDAHSFGRAGQLRSLLLELAADIPLENAWETQLAAMLSPIGLVTLPPETILKLREGQTPSDTERKLIVCAPEIAARLLANIPRLNGVSTIIRYQHKHFDGSGFPPDNCKGEDIPRGARLLNILLDLQELRALHLTQRQALDQMSLRTGQYDPQLLAMVRKSLCNSDAQLQQSKPARSVGVRDLTVGMLLRSDVRTTDGTLVLKAGDSIQDVSLGKIQLFQFVFGIQEPVSVDGPAPPEVPTRANGR